MSFEKFNVDVQQEEQNAERERMVNPVEINEEQLGKLIAFVEPFFETASDPTQIPATEEAYRKLLALDSHSVELRADSSGNVVSYAAVLPTSKELMEKFLGREVTEREMFDRTEAIHPEALYLMAVAVDKNFKGKGDVFGMMKEIIQYFQGRNPDLELFVWEFSEEGKRFVSILEHRYGVTVKRY